MAQAALGRPRLICLMETRWKARVWPEIRPAVMASRQLLGAEDALDEEGLSG
jgi:hypothetical protein